MYAIITKVRIPNNKIRKELFPMKKGYTVFFTVAVLVAAAFLAGGCGGSSSDSAVDQSYYDYEPPNLTEEDLIELARTQVDPSEFDLPELNEDTTSADSFDASDTVSYNARVRTIWTEAVRLFSKPLIANKAIIRGITKHPQPDGTDIFISQARYVYVLRWTHPSYEVDNEVLTAPAVQHNFAGSCQHGVYGTDCVGFVWNAANNAGITLWGATSRSRVGPSGLTTASSWTRFFPQAKDVSSEIGKQKPQPGDIVSWGIGHVGIAAKFNDNDGDRIVILHCTGNTDRGYTCSQYKAAGETPSALNSQVNGVTAHEYDVDKGITYFGRESKRLRLYVASDSEQDNPNVPVSPEPDNPSEPVTPENPQDNPPSGTITANSLNGTWTGSGSGTGTNSGITAPVNTELRYTIRNVNLSSGTAEIDIYDKTTNAQYGVNIERGVNYDNKSGGGYRNFSVTNSGSNQWTFHTTYSDGEDNIVITLNSPTTGTLRLYGVMWNEDNPSDRTTYNITCNITKQ